MGRFISVDPLMASGSTGDPQSWSRYSYSYNNPLRYTDPTGMVAGDYFSEDGKKLGSDDKADGMIYVVKGTASDNKTTKLELASAVVTMPNLSVRKGIIAATDRTAQPTTYYKGKESSKNDPAGNFHEEAVVAGNNQVIAIAPGALATSQKATTNLTVAANPADQAALDAMWQNNQVEVVAHTHPAGGQFPPPKPGAINTGGLMVNPDQPPSTVDISNADNARLNILTSTRENKVYFYNQSGTIATFPLNTFRKLSK
jgi:hypothetical protein